MRLIVFCTHPVTEPETDSWVLELPATDTIYVKSAALFMTAFSAVRVKFTANP